MGKKKTTTTSTATHGFYEQPKNADYETARSLVGGIDYQTPVKQSYGRLRNEIGESGNEFFGDNTPDSLRSRIKESRLFKATTDEGEALSSAVGMENQAKTNGYMALGDATKPYFVQTGGTQVTETPRDYLGGALGIANTGARFAAM